MINLGHITRNCNQR